MLVLTCTKLILSRLPTSFPCLSFLHVCQFVHIYSSAVVDNFLFVYCSYESGSSLSKLIWNAYITKVMLTLSMNSLQYADIKHRPPLVHSIPKHSQCGLMITFNHHTAAIMSVIKCAITTNVMACLWYCIIEIYFFH